MLLRMAMVISFDSVDKVPVIHGSKNSENREQSRACLSYAEVHPVFAGTANSIALAGLKTKQIIPEIPMKWAIFAHFLHFVLHAVYNLLCVLQKIVMNLYDLLCPFSKKKCNFAPKLE